MEQFKRFKKHFNSLYMSNNGCDSKLYNIWNAMLRILLVGRLRLIVSALMSYGTIVLGIPMFFIFDDRDRE